MGSEKMIRNITMHKTLSEIDTRKRREEETENVFLNKLKDGSYIIVPKTLEIIKGSNNSVLIKIGKNVLKGKLEQINSGLSIIIIRVPDRKNTYYIIDEANTNYYFIKDNKKKLPMMFNSIMKAIEMRLRFKEKIKAIKKVELVGDKYIFYFNRKKDLFIYAPEKYYIIMGGKKHYFTIDLTKNSALLSISEFNKLYIGKIQSWYMRDSETEDLFNFQLIN